MTSSSNVAANGKFSAKLRWPALLLGTALLAGCGGGSDFGDIQSYMDEVNARPKGRIEPLPPFEQVPPFAYKASTKRSPFEPPALVQIVPERNTGPKVKPNPDRVKEFLEQFPIGNLSMVGTLSQRSQLYALIQDSQGGVHRVSRGNYMGTDHGRINSINDGEVELIEIVPDGTGGWVERKRKVELGTGE